MKYWNLIILFLMVSFTKTVGQPVDEALMDKDLQVAENILSTLMKQSSNNQFMFLGQGLHVDGKYLPNYGVVFNVSSNQLKIMTFNRTDGDGESTGGWETEGADQKNPVMMMINVYKDFLSDYGNMIRQLKSTDKILVRNETSRNLNAIAAYSGHKKVKANSGISAEVTKADLIAYEKGDIDRDALIEKIKIKENLNDGSKEPQSEVFSSMLERLYEIDLSDTYYMANEPGYDRMENFGITYYLKFYSSTVHDDNNYSLPTISKKNVSKVERNKIVDEMYPGFLRGFKQNILDYGHVLKNLSADEMLVFHMKLTSCEGCNMPSVISVSLKKSIIDDYRAGTLSLEKAMELIEVKNVED